MDQGAPEYLGIIGSSDVKEIASALNLKTENIADYLLEVISTGLPYLIVPILSGIENARIVISNFENLLEKHGAKFVYILDVNNIEGRTWNNSGSIEDIATGSAAGPSAAFLYKNNLVVEDRSFELSQGRFLGRPGKIEVCINVENNQIRNVFVGGQVAKVADIVFAPAGDGAY